MDCLNNIIGLSKDPCDCFEIDATTSLSGLFLDDTTMGRLPLSAAAFDCSDPNFNAYLNRLRTDAVTETIDLLYKEMTNQLIQKVRDTVVNLPTKQSYSGLLPMQTYHYIRIQPKAYRGLYLHISKLAIPNHDTSTNVIIKDDSNTLFFDDLLSNFTPMKLLLDRNYIIMYEPLTAPKNYKMKCCGNSYPFEQYLYISGGSTTDQNVINKFDQYSHNIEMTAVISCDPFRFLCDIDFENNRWGRVFATTVLLVARKNMLAWIMNSGLITNYLTTQDPEQLNGLMNYYIDEIADRLKFLPSKYDYSDCYICGGSFKRSIII
jgi:hypothetical protein